MAIFSVYLEWKKTHTNFFSGFLGILFSQTYLPFYLSVNPKFPLLANRVLILSYFGLYFFVGF